MATINVLDSETINKIAAGEVVERPASVVKELVENAIDAHATAITVEIKDGGTSLIRVTDNGSGIEKDDIPLAFLRHSTSKIRTADDLYVIASLGFRGEALSSIASVAQVELVTKTASDLTGIRCCVEGGKQTVLEEVGCPGGTTMIVRNLFYNTPARRKFLKSDMTEAGYVNDLIMRLALSHPEISFKFINNRQNKIHTAGNMQLKDIIYNIYGRDITANLLEVNRRSSTMEISGYIGKPLISRGNRAYENYFINGRYIKSPVITKAIEEAYKNFVMVHKYPFTAFHLQMDTSLMDVNVHPTKMEVRFNQGEEVYQLVYRTIREALEGRNLIPDVTLESDREISQRQRQEAKEHLSAPAPEPFEVHRRQNAELVKPWAATPVGGSAPKKAWSNSFAPAKASEDTPLKEQDNIPVKSAAGAPTIKTPEETFAGAPAKVSEEAPVYGSAGKETRPEQMELFNDQILPRKKRLTHRLIGQLFDTYWLVEYDQKLFIIDQHAAHEKVMYEKLKKHYENSTALSQLLEPPMILSLTMQEEETLNRHISQFTKLGFEIEPFGGREYAIRAVPSELYGFTERDLFVDLLDSLTAQSGHLTADLINDRLATMACKAAVKGNQRLSVPEANALIEELLEAQNPYNCPHGRPTIISMSQYELEKKFKRIQ